MGGGVLAKLARDNPMLATLQSTNALTPLPCEVRHGFVWVMPKPRDVLDVAAFLGPLDAALAARGVEHWLVRERREMPLDASELPRTTRLELAGDTLSVYGVRRRRPESDFGEATDAAVGPSTLERLVLGPA